ncbi:fumarylacetoacetate hydrolase family protein [Streptomyces sp. WM6386]|uniref:fumarylacetoacetate hydrolase family protein n=1 Tax=Streptomyces sp. WM6386 TaxID=1415558 RepID=UPI000A848326|nr:fumarylacetoacetate hydrolase family protein [Streptomyces sp. WM6386]
MFWAVIDPEADSATPLPGPIAAWAPMVMDGAVPTAAAGRTRGLSDLTLLPPLERGSTVVVAGANYSSHLVALGSALSDRPAMLLKPHNAIIGTGQEIAFSPLTEQLDYEVELVAVIGAARPGPSESAVSAWDRILGYTVGNDVTARDLALGGVLKVDMFSAKVLDHATGLGPWIVTRDEFGDGQPDLELTLSVDGEVRQHDRTSSMARNVAELLDYADARTSLGPGDILFTGTPAGVGHEDGRYLQPGQKVVASVEGIGSITNVVGPRG